MFKFSYFDVETPSLYQDSICQIALISDKAGASVILDYLVDPEDDFHPRNVAIHGITGREVVGQPTFPDIWPVMREHFQDRVVVGHNVKFDLSVLYKNIYHYGFEPFDIYYIDTMDLLRSKKLECGLGLKESCRYFNIKLDQHHNALQDTWAAFDLFQVLTQDVDDLNRFIKKYMPGPRCYGYKRHLFRGNPHFSLKPPTVRLNQTTQKICEMKDLLSSISADRQISQLELYKLREWLLANEALSGNYPFDVLITTVTNIFDDGIVTAEEHGFLLDLIGNFLDPRDNLKSGPVEEFSFSGQVVCLTGDFYYGSKPDVKEVVERQGGLITSGVTKKTTMVLVGSLGSARWSYGNYGSKVKKAMELKEAGQAIRIIPENDIKLGNGYE